MYMLQNHTNYFFFLLLRYLLPRLPDLPMGSFSVDFPLVAQRGMSCLTLARMTASDSCGTIPSHLGRSHTVYGNYCRNLESLNPSRRFILGTRMVRSLHAWCLGGFCFSV